MKNINIEIRGRRSGKTTKIRQLIEEEVAKGEYKVIAMASTHTCLKNLTEGISKETKLSNNYSELSFRSVGAEWLDFRLRGHKKIKIFFDEIYLLDELELDKLFRLIEASRNIELSSYTSYRQ